MVTHYLPISISNRTTAAVQVKHESSISSSIGYLDLVGPYQTTPTKAVQTDFKLQKLESLISIDLEQPELIKIELTKRQRKVNHFQNGRCSSGNTSLAPDADPAAPERDQRLPHQTRNLTTKMRKILQNNPNKKFSRLNCSYYLHGQPVHLQDLEDLDEEDSIGNGHVEFDAEALELEARGQDNELHEARDGAAGGSSEGPSRIQIKPGDRFNTRAHGTRKKKFIPRYEIFQSVSGDGSVSIMLLKYRDFSNWMSHLPDDIPISELAIPGSHQSCALYGRPIAQCQTRSLSRQLKDGIRFLDIRLALPLKSTTNRGKKNDQDEAVKLIAYHGIQSEKITFQEILAILNDFLTSQPTETIIVSIKRENHCNAELFRKTLFNELIEVYETEANLRERWWLDSSLPDHLHQVRGKLILFSRKLFQYDENDIFGIRFPIWPNNSAEIWETSIPNTKVAVQDWYDIGSFLSIPQKSTLACVSLCGAIHDPLRSGSSPIPPAGTPSAAASIKLLGNSLEASQVHRELEATTSEPLVQPKERQDRTEDQFSQRLQGGAKESNSIEVTLNRTDGPSNVTGDERPKTWVITFLSASSVILGFPMICARGVGFPKIGLEIEGINTKVARWLVLRRDRHQHNLNENTPTTIESNIKGVVCLMDFYQHPKEALVSLLVDCNFSS